MTPTPPALEKLQGGRGNLDALNLPPRALGLKGGKVLFPDEADAMPLDHIGQFFHIPASNPNRRLVEIQR
jgi:hypothetical protein